MNCKFHNVRFYNVEPRAIHCMVLEPKSRRLAVSRSNASIEIWDLKGTPHMNRVICGAPEASVEAMCWVRGRLLSAGLSGAVVEWDLQTLAVRQSVIVTGQAAWCIDATRAATKIAVGTEQGYINIYSVEDGTIIYERIFDKQEGRILCCKFDPSGKILVTGSIETLRIWNVASGQALHRMTTGRAERNKETIVWCLAVTADLTVISGDSRGRLTFWDARVGEQLESVSTHKADVLSICLSEDEGTVYCAGVDPLIVSFAKVRMKHKGDNKQIEKWVKNIQRNIHQHDVRALVLLENKLFSGGVDGYLAMSSFPPKMLVKFPPLHLQPSVTFCQQARLVCLRYTSSLEVWRLGSALLTDRGQSYAAEEAPEKMQNGHGGCDTSLVNGERETYSADGLETLGRRLRLAEGAQMLLKVDSKNGEHLNCCAVSPDASWIAYSTDSQFRIFKFTIDDNVPTLSKLALLPAECIPCNFMAFSPDSRSLLVATANCIIRLLHIHSDGAVLSGQTINAQTVLKDCTLIHLQVSSVVTGGAYCIAAADADSNIGVWQIRSGEQPPPANLLAQLPKHAMPPSALAFDHHDNTLFVAYTDHKIIEYNLTHLRFTKLSKRLRGSPGLGPKWLARMFPVSGLAAHPTNPNLLMLYDDCAVYLINKAEINDEQSEGKRPRKQFPNKESKLYYTVKKYKHLAAASWLGEDEAAVVVLEPDALLEKLPPAFFKKRFGAM